MHIKKQHINMYAFFIYTYTYSIIVYPTCCYISHAALHSNVSFTFSYLSEKYHHTIYFLVPHIR